MTICTVHYAMYKCVANADLKACMKKHDILIVVANLILYFRRNVLEYSVELK